MMRPVTTALTDLRRLSFKYENNSRVIVTFWYADMIVSRYLLEDLHHCLFYSPWPWGVLKVGIEALQRISFPYDKEVSCPAVDSDAEIGDLIENGFGAFWYWHVVSDAIIQRSMKN